MTPTAPDGDATVDADPRGGDRRPLHGLWRRWSLQTRLMLTVVSIVALTLVASAVGLSTTIGTVLIGTVESNVRTLTVGLQLFDNNSYVLRARTADEAILGTGGLPHGYTLLVQSPTGQTTAATYDEDGIRGLSPRQFSQLASVDPNMAPTTVELPGLGAYRVVSFSAGDVSGLAGLPLAEVDSTVARLVTTITVVTTGGLLLLSAAIAVVIQRSLRPLRVVADTASRVAALPLAQGAVSITERVPAEEADDHDEIGRVGAALNTLLDHVDSSLVARQRNEERMRSFVADASHELRTPLASIRGYSELSLRAMRQGVPGVEETTTSALERIQAQSLRMTRLVEDLLLLARLDEGQELVYGTIDLTALAVDCVADARAAGQDHEWRLEVGDEPVVVAGDATRIAQVVANLLANARVHTPAGTTVTTSVRLDDGNAVLTVHDDGPGIDPALADEIFERFSRADRSRARQTGGTGLGLSIARAIVAAHGGSLTVHSEPGSTAFELRLTARPADPAPGTEPAVP
ncbi:sensor histidine kinase [Microbacterium thalli]|uniref:histidine kinase n=1 Tax=Microbacterium thalli TaxID=3027921 RepID=A0ABT5SL28_9MICO|nr:ATP-binding protein [Microbacterium thalli]MDD7963366.1 ATP-binding protein [Microbacterium thalli]